MNNHSNPHSSWHHRLSGRRDRQDWWEQNNSTSVSAACDQWCREHGIWEPDRPETHSERIERLRMEREARE